MNKIIKILFLFISMTSCYSRSNEKVESNELVSQNDSIKIVTFAVSVKPQKGTILNLANQFYDNLELRFFNDSSKEKIIYRNLSLSKTKLITQLGIYMPNPSSRFTFQHAFLVNKDYDTIYLSVTDSMDIFFTKENKKTINFIDEYTSELAKVREVKSFNEIDKKRENALLKLSNKNLSAKEKKEIQCYIQQTYLYSVLRFQNSQKIGKYLPQSQTSALKEFLNQYDSILSPNLQLLEIFNIIKNDINNRNLSSENSCKKFSFIKDFRKHFDNYTAQAYILNELKSSNLKNDSCWIQASKNFTSTLFYTKNKEKVDSILFKAARFSFKNSIENFKLIDAKGNLLRLNQLLANQQKKVYILDFWATWCIPCNKENEILKTKLSKISNNIGVIKISLDDDKNIELWKKKIYKDEIHLKAIGGFENEFCKQFKLTEIPRYMLINSKGELLNDDFYRPSDSSFIKYLNSSLIGK